MLIPKTAFHIGNKHKAILNHLCVEKALNTSSKVALDSYIFCVLIGECVLAVLSGVILAFLDGSSTVLGIDSYPHCKHNLL